MRYRVKFYPYSGGSTSYNVPAEMDECRRIARQLIRRHRNVMEYPVTVLEAGRKWELETGEDAVMIGDNEGILAIVEIDDEESDCDDEFDDDGNFRDEEEEDEDE